MANEISTNVSLAVRKNFLNKTLSTSGSFTLTAANPAEAAGVYSVATTAAGVALPLGSLTTPGWGYFKNLDATNFVNIGVQVAGTFYPFLKLFPGEGIIARLGLAAPYVRSDTAATLLEYELFDN